jgi:photosystem II stability/assembly factor-like uncharacterized protein
MNSRLRNSILLFSLLFICFNQSFSQSGWISQASGTTNDLRGVSFTDSNTGTIVGTNGTILRTINGGDTWSRQSSGITDNLYGVSFSNTNTGTVIGANGVILHTTDGGATWTTQSSGTTKYLYGISFTYANTGSVIGSDIILHTTDGGMTWNNQSTGLFTLTTSNSLYAVSFASSTIGVVVGQCNYPPNAIPPVLSRLIITTTNGGSNWTTSVGSNFTGLIGVSLFNATIGTAVGFGGTILRTTDGGSTWRGQQSGTTTTGLTAVFFTDVNTGFVVGWDGTILCTTDGGTKWTSQSSGTTNNLMAVSFSTAQIGTIVGLGGVILHTTTGGKTNVNVESDAMISLPEQYTLNQNFPNPFNPITSFSFDLPSKSFVQLTIFDIIGRKVTELISKELSAGSYTHQWNAEHYPSGVYFYCLRAGSFAETKKLILLR